MQSKTKYEFYIIAERDQVIDIEIKRNRSIINSTYDRIISHYNEKLSDGTVRKDVVNHVLSPKNNVFTDSYVIYSSLCIYVFFELEPDNTLMEVYIRAFATTYMSSNNIYNLTNATSLSIGSMKSYYYKFYIPAKYDQTISFKLTKSGSSDSAKTNITCYEYLTREAIVELRKERIPFYYSNTDKYYIIYFRAQNSQTQYVAFELKPTYAMEEVSVISYVISPIIIEYDLESGIYKYFSDLKFENNYKFYLPVKHNYTVEIVLNDYREADSTVYQYKMTIYEYLNRNSAIELMRKIVDLPYDSTRKFNRYFYNVYNDSTNYLVAELRPPGEKISASIQLYSIIPPDFEYNIISDTNYYFKNFSNLYIYKFYIPAKEKQTLDIEFTNDEKFEFNPLQNITLYEYSTRYEKKELIKWDRNFDYISSLNYFILPFGVGHYYFNYPINYVAFEIKPFSNMTNVYLKATLKNKEGYAYDLINDTQIYIPTFIRERTYRFYISAKYNQSLELELTKSDSESYFPSIGIYEYLYRSSTELCKNYLSFEYNSNTNSYRILYLIKNVSTNEVAFEIDVSYYHYYISVYLKAKVKQYDFEIDLVKGFPKFLEKFFSTATYKFYIPAKYHQKVNIEFTGDIDYYSKKQYINIYEYSRRAFITESKNTSQYLISEYQSRGNYIYYSNYTIYDPNTNYVAFEITPNYELKSIFVTPFITSWATYEWDLTRGNSQKFGAFYTHEIVRFYISAEYGQKINIKITKKNSEYSPYQMINIYEFPKRTSLDELRYLELCLIYNSKKKSYTQSYTVYKNETTFIAFEFKPDFDMREVTVKASIDGYDDEEDEEQSYIAIIVISIIFVVCIFALIIYFYIRKKRKNENKLQNLTSQATTQPLYPLSLDNN